MQQRIIIAGVALSVALTGCGGGGGSSAEAVPVEEQLGFDREGILARQAKVEHIIRDCMQQQGFEYTPVDPAAREATLTGGTFTEQEFEKQFGYGITTLYEQRRQQAAGGPNEKVRAALSPADRRAYDLALLGDPGSDTYAVALDNGDFSNLGGCTKKATEEAFGGPGFAQSIQAKLDDLDAKIVADPRMQAAIKKWSECMRTAGFDLSDPQEVDATLIEELKSIVGSSEEASTSDATAEPTYDKTALTALQRKEVELVNTDIACENQHITSVEDTVRTEVEKQFREQNADLLDKAPTP